MNFLLINFDKFIKKDIKFTFKLKILVIIKKIIKKMKSFDHFYKFKS